MAASVMDLFCGTGGFSKGFENTGKFEVVFGIDLLRSSVATFALNHPAALSLHGDIRNVRRSEVRDQMGRESVDVIIGGPPCQGFSSIRPFRSSAVDDPRNNLFEEFAAYVGVFRPRVVVFENVVGLVTHRDGATLEQIQEEFANLGYEVDWRILNAAHFGVPQKRERLILIAVERGGKIQFPQPTHSGRFRTIGVADPTRRVEPPGDQPSLFNPLPTALPPAHTVADAISDLPALASGEEAAAYTTPPRNDYQRARRQHADARLDLHSSTRHSERMLEIIRHSGSSISSIPRHLITSGFTSSYSRLAADEPSVTITVNFVHPASNRCIHPTQDRALTPREGARIQSFDDDFRFAGSRAEIIKQIGNAVPPLLGVAISKAVVEMLGSSMSTGTEAAG